MRALVLGAAGFIGGAIYSRLYRNPDYDVQGWTRQSADLEHHDLVLPGCDILYLCAGKTGGVGKMADDPLSFVLPNVKIHMNVFAAAQEAGIPKVVCVQSTTGYPDSPFPMLEDDYAKGPLHPMYYNPGTAHRFIWSLGAMFKDLEISFFRPSNVYGPGNDFSVQHSHVIEATVRKVAEKQDPLVIWGTGQEIRDAVYIDDLVNAMVMDLPPGAYNVASGEEMTVLEIVDALCSHADHHPVLKFDVTRPTAIPARRLSIDKLRHMGWQPKIGMREGLAKTYDWYESLRSDSQAAG